MKKVTKCFLALSICLSASTAMAHGTLGRESKSAGDYQIVMEATADVPDPYEHFAITYAFMLLNKDASQYVAFDSARVSFAQKRGGLILNALLSTLSGGVPGTEVEAAMPEAGDYTAEVTFLKRSKEIAKTSFDFVVKGLPKTTLDPPQRVSTAVPRYVWALVLFAAGITLGKFSTRIYRWVFLDE